MRIALFAAFAAGAMAISPAPLGEKSVLVAFRKNFEDSVKEAQKRNLPLLFIYGKDH